MKSTSTPSSRRGADIRTGASPDERGLQPTRTACAATSGAVLLVDLSASTDDILPQERDANTTRPSDDLGKAQDIRDPYFDEDEEYDFAARMAEEAAKRRSHRHPARIGTAARYGP